MLNNKLLVYWKMHSFVILKKVNVNFRHDVIQDVELLEDKEKQRNELSKNVEGGLGRKNRFKHPLGRRFGRGEQRRRGARECAPFVQSNRFAHSRGCQRL